mmetsp:Transcript_44341/g.72171  ORF Transcript_44341/g.72171 Transcript_44341/m.72171 type:complete len:92 (-) Transcript_44341:1171-1446(-)
MSLQQYLHLSPLSVLQTPLPPSSHFSPVPLPIHMVELTSVPGPSLPDNRPRQAVTILWWLKAFKCDRPHLRVTHRKASKCWSDPGGDLKAC